MRAGESSKRGQLDPFRLAARSQQGLAVAFQPRVVSRIANQGVLELVEFLRGISAHLQQVSLAQLLQTVMQRFAGTGPDCFKPGMKLPLQGAVIVLD